MRAKRRVADAARGLQAETRTRCERTASGEGRPRKHSAGDLVVLIVEDDDKFAVSLLELAREIGFKGVVAAEAGAALNMVKDLAPDAITLDLRLPDMDGWAVLDVLKPRSGNAAHPVSIISVEERMQKYLHMERWGGAEVRRERRAHGCPCEDASDELSTISRTLLVAADGDAEPSINSSKLWAETACRSAKCTPASRLSHRCARIQVDCLVVGHGLRDMSPTDLVKEVARFPTASKLPIVMYGADESRNGERDKIKKLAEAMVLKDAQTLDALLAETTLFLHQAVSDLPRDKRHQVLAIMHGSIPDLAGKKALIVDDDIRNIFALTGALEQHGWRFSTRKTERTGSRR